MPTSGVVATATGSATVPVPLKITTNRNLQPGTYFGGICIGAAVGNDCTGSNCNPSVASNPTVTLDPGMYIIAGGGFQVCGHATLIAPHVTIFNTNDPSASVLANPAYAKIGQILINTAGLITLGPQTRDQDALYAGFTIFVDRNQVVDPPTFTPTAYNPAQQLSAPISATDQVFTVNGTTSQAVPTIGAGNVIVIDSEKMIVNTVTVNGTTSSTIAVNRGYAGTTPAVARRQHRGPGA